MSMSIRMETQDKNVEFFRFGQEFTYDTIQYTINRNPYGVKLTEGIIEDALKRFDVTDEDGEVLDWNEDLWEILEPYWSYVKLAGKWERGHGKSLIQLFDDDDAGLIIRAFNMKNYEPEYKTNGVMDTLTTTQRTVDGKETMLDFSRNPEGDEFDLENTYEIIMRPTEKLGEGRAYIERVWDQLFALGILDEHATYFAIRVGGGLKVMKVPEDKLEDDKTMTKIEENTKKVNSGNGVLIIPLFEGLEQQPEFMLESGTQIDFIQLRDLLLGSISASTGIPREVLLGSELGLRSAETNESAYFAIIQTVQEQYKPVLRWLVNRIAAATQGLPEDPDFKISYIKRDVQTDDEKLDLLLKKSDVAERLKRVGFTLESIQLLLELEELEIREMIENPDMIQDQFSSDDDDQDDEQDDDMQIPIPQSTSNNNGEN